MRITAHVAALLAVAAFVAPRICRADDAQEFELAKNRFDLGQYEQAHVQFTNMLDASLPTCDKAPSRRCRIVEPDLVERALSLDAASLVALKRLDEADAQIEKLLRLSPSYVPNPALFPPEVLDRFTLIRSLVRKDIEKAERDKAQKDFERREGDRRARAAEQAWLEEIERLAKTEKRVEVHSRWIAMIPFGAGQYQNGDTGLGAFFTASELLFGAGSLLGAGIAASYSSASVTQRDASGHIVSVDTVALNSRIQLAAALNRIAFAAWGATTLVGIVQAQIAFRADKETTRPRALPPRPKVVPTVSVMPGGMGVGVVAVF